jgi:hypothetical protein
MNCTKWFSALSETLDRWKSSRAIRVIENRVSPPESEAVIEQMMESSLGMLPPDLVSFYAQGCAECDVSFLIQLPHSLTLEDFDMGSSPKELEAGFSIAPITKLPAMRSDLCDMFDSVPDIGSVDSTRFRPFKECAVPLWRTEAGGYVVYLGENQYRSPGIYMIDVECLAWPEPAIKYADSLFEWLAFLEESCYIGPSRWDVALWHNGSRLVPNLGLRNRLMKVIQDN